MTLRRAAIAFIASALFAATAHAQDADSAIRLEIVYESQSLERAISLGEPRFRPVGRYTQMQLQAQNVSRREAAIEYKVEWFDGEGFSAQSLSAWQPLILTPQASATINSVGQVANARNARITFRDPERTR
ncbi:MAG: DUF1425 domain-containing protein [Hyphomonadaceae bacterium]|nr:DUF1425 domain-containing protein [Hyphomonadaceae bacterium]